MCGESRARTPSPTRRGRRSSLFSVYINTDLYTVYSISSSSVELLRFIIKEETNKYAKNNYTINS